MNFELADELTKLIETDKLVEAIQLAEKELKKVPQTKFHKILGRDMNHLQEEIQSFIRNFDTSTTKKLNRKSDFIRSIFNKKNQLRPKAYYCEMNGFTINYDRWYLDLFSYNIEEDEELDWLSDYYDCSKKDFTITGLEDIQQMFQEVHENDELKNPILEKSYEICELLIILRLQQLFKQAYSNQDTEWSKVPMYVTAHDYHMVYLVK